MLPIPSTIFSSNPLAFQSNTSPTFSIVKSQIKSFEDACKFLAIAAILPTVTGVPAKYQKGIVADYKRVIITEALNKEANDGKDWVPVYDGSEYHYFPYFRMDDKKDEPRGSGFRFSCSGFAYRISSVGSRLEFISEDVCYYAVETFPEIFRDCFVVEESTSAPQKS